MSSISSYLEKRAYASNSERMLLTEDGLTIATTAGLGFAHFNELNEKELFESWETEFSDKFNQKMNEFANRRISSLEEYENLLQGNNISSYADLKDSDETQNLLRNLRNDDVRSRWDLEQFFAEEGNEGARRVLGYYSYEDGNSAYNVYSDEQFNQLVETGKVGVEMETLQGHHIKDVSSHALEMEQLKTLFHVDNIRLMTRTAHQQDPDYGHGGSWQNQTTGEGAEVNTRFDGIIDENKSITGENIAKFDIQIGFGVGIVVGSVSAFLEIRKLKDDPRPWKRKALLISTSAFVRGFEAGTLALLALKTRTAISSLGESDMIQSNVEAANQVLTEAFPGDLTSTLDAETLATVAGFSASIAELRIIRSGITAVGQWRQSNFKVAFRQFGKDSMVIIAEESVFLGSALLINMLYEAGEDAIIPDPTGGFIIAARVGWSLGKKGYQYKVNKETMEICKQKRLDGLYETAIVSLLYLG